VLAVLDIKPASPGHLVLLPKNHYDTVDALPLPLLEQLAKAVKRLSWISLRALGAEGTTVMLQAGKHAGQSVPHILFHIIPRKEQDGLPLVLPEQPFSSQDINDIRTMVIKGIKQVIEGDTK